MAFETLTEYESAFGIIIPEPVCQDDMDRSWYRITPGQILALATTPNLSDESAPYYMRPKNATKVAVMGRVESLEHDPDTGCEEESTAFIQKIKLRHVAVVTDVYDGWCSIDRASLEVPGFVVAAADLEELSHMINARESDPSLTPLVFGLLGTEYINPGILERPSNNNPTIGPLGNVMNMFYTLAMSQR